jgi:hypothetical protein
MKHIFLAWMTWLIVASSVLAQSIEPPELPRLRGSYEAAVQRALKPLHEAYRNELDKLRDSYTKAGKLDEALAIVAELKVIDLKLGISAAKPGDERAVAKVPAEFTGGKEVRIPANDANGFALGPVNRGDVITVQYVKGLWKSHGNLATASPDDPTDEGGDNNRLAIAQPPERGSPGKLIKLVPPSTKEKPFKFAFPTSRPNVVLRINAHSDNAKNPGGVTYRVTITH